ncbi:MAG: GHKL domain-containing protein [Saprospiraceae bacterium]|nr:GHKL domain-containing protein [Saprospiraceae bacterium]
MKFEALKNITANKLASLISVCISSLIALILLFIGIIKPELISAYTAFICIISVLVFGFFITRSLIKEFIYRRIKLIYKIITDTKLPEELVKESKFKEHMDLEQVEKDAYSWIKKKNSEIDHIKQMENFRREYIGNVSHELKTPVFNIQAYLQTIHDMDSLQDEQLKIFLDKAIKNTFRLQEIIDDLSVVDKLESGDYFLDKQTFNIKELSDEVFEEQQGLADQKNIKLIFKEGADADNLVIADREYIRIALSNLVNNSIKYGKYNGFVKMSFYKLDESLLIEVSDNGIGIPEEHLSHVFDRFYRVDKSRSRDQGGSGLGLSIVKHILESHHQKLHVRSKDGVGTTFGFTLQLSDKIMTF